MPSMEELHEDIKYAFSCIDAYLDSFPRERVRNAHICEIGPGKNLIVGLTFKSLGAAQVYVADKYFKPWSDDYHAPYIGLWQKPSPRAGLQPNQKVFRQCLDARGTLR